MKNLFKKFIFCVIFFLMFSGVFAQTKFHGGFFAGIAASQISGDQLTGFNKPGIYAGGFTNIFFAEKFGIQMELYFIQKGSRRVPKNNYSDIYKLNLQYIELPLLFKWNFIKRLYLELGPAFGVLMKTSGVEKDAYGVVPNPNRPVFNHFDFCAIGGLGVNFTDHIKTNIRFENSVIPVRKPEVGTSWRLDRWQYNSTLSLSFIYEI